jgi:hypothetical protein
MWPLRTIAIFYWNNNAIKHDPLIFSEPQVPLSKELSKNFKYPPSGDSTTGHVR